MSHATDIPPAHLDPREDRMNKAVRERLMASLAEAGRLCPYMGFGQLVCMLTLAAEAAVPDSTYDVEDGELLQATEEFIRSREGRRSAA